MIVNNGTTHESTYECPDYSKPDLGLRIEVKTSAGNPGQIYQYQNSKCSRKKTRT